MIALWRAAWDFYLWLSDVVEDWMLGDEAWQ